MAFLDAVGRDLLGKTCLVIPGWNREVRIVPREDLHLLLNC